MIPKFKIGDKVNDNSFNNYVDPFIIDNYCVFKDGRILYYKDMDSKGVEEQFLTLYKEQPKTETRYHYMIKSTNISDRPYVSDILFLDDEDIKNHLNLGVVAWFRRIEPGHEVPV